MAATYTYRYHCSQCGFTDSVKYLMNPNLRGEEQKFYAYKQAQKQSQAGSAGINKNLWKIGTGVLAVFLVGCAILFALLPKTNKTDTEAPAVVTSNVNQELSGVDIVREVKEEMERKKGKMTDGDYNTIYLKLVKIKPNTAAYSEAQKILAQNKKQIEKAIRDSK